jgi:hypothetical protein
MDTDASKSVSHNITIANIRGVRAIIRNDVGTYLYPFNGTLNITGYTIRIAAVGSSDISLQRETSGFFDSTDFDSVGGYVRGWVIIDHV